LFFLREERERKGHLLSYKEREISLQLSVMMEEKKADSQHTRRGEGGGKEVSRDVQDRCIPRAVLDGGRGGGTVYFILRGEKGTKRAFVFFRGKKEKHRAQGLGERGTENSAETEKKKERSNSNERKRGVLR